MEITAAVVLQDRHFTNEKVELGELKSDEVLVKIVAAGMCHTDLAAKDQHMPFPLPAILGHEGAGIVLEVGAEVPGVSPGDHVVLTFASCGQCPNCLAGKPAYCLKFMAYNFGTRRPDGSCCHHLHGEPVAGSFFYQSSFATHAIAHVSNVVVVPQDLPLDVLAPLGCGIQTGAGAVLNCLKPEAEASIVVFGLGAVGLSALMAAKISGCRKIIAVDLHDSRLALAKELGATDCVNGSKGDAVEEVRRLTDGAGANYSIDATGVPAVMRQAVDVLTIGGSAIFLGVAPVGATVAIDAFSFMFGKTIRSSVEGDSVPKEFIPKLIELYREGRFPIEKMATYYDLADINRAAADSASGKAIKPIIRMPA
jgi:aryl-alcohol dehydrogenase